MYILLTPKTYEMHMFHSDSLKLRIDREVLIHLISCTVISCTVISCTVISCS